MAGLPEHGKTSRGRIRSVLVAIVLLAVACGGAAYALLSGQPSGATTSTSTEFAIGANSVVSAVASQGTSGYSLESAKANGSASADWAVLGSADGSVANLTALVFASSNDSQAYFARLVSSLEGLPGYTEVSSALSAYQQYGRCYGYGEDVDGIAVVNGVCTEGNVFLQVHLVSNKSFGDLEADMTSLMGALYGSVD